MKKFILEKIHLIIPLITATALCIYAFGCEAKTASLINPDRMVNRERIVWELAQLTKLSKNAIADLDRQLEIRDIIFQQGLVVAQGGTLNPIGVITTLMAILGLGGIADDVRLRKKVKRDSQNKTIV